MFVGLLIRESSDTFRPLGASGTSWRLGKYQNVHDLLARLQQQKSIIRTLYSSWYLPTLISPIGTGIRIEAGARLARILCIAFVWGGQK